MSKGLSFGILLLVLLGAAGYQLQAQYRDGLVMQDEIRKSHQEIGALHEKIERWRKRSSQFVSKQMQVVSDLESRLNVEKGRFQAMGGQLEPDDSRRDQEALDEAEQDLVRQRDIVAEVKARLDKQDVQMNTDRGRFNEGLQDQKVVENQKVQAIQEKIKAQQQIIHHLGDEIAEHRQQRVWTDLPSLERQLSDENTKLKDLNSLLQQAKAETYQTESSAKVQVQQVLSTEQETRKQILAEYQQAEKTLQDLRNNAQGLRQKLVQHRSSRNLASRQLNDEKAKVQDLQKQLDEQQAILNDLNALGK